MATLGVTGICVEKCINPLPCTQQLKPGLQEEKLNKTKVHCYKLLFSNNLIDTTIISGHPDKRGLFFFFFP